MLDRLSQDPAISAQIEVEIHDRFRRLGGPMNASLLAEETIAEDRAETESTGDAASTDRNEPWRRGG